MPRQSDLAKAAGLHQSRISSFETPGAANVTLETLSRLAAAFEVGLIVKFVPMSEMLRWENEFSQQSFRVRKLGVDEQFLSPDSPNSVTSQRANEGENHKIPVRSAGLENPTQSSFELLGSIASNKQRSAEVA